MAEKRTAESTKNIDTFAVCNLCNRISNNPNTCDRCGAHLSKENSAACYSSEAKRQRTNSHSPLVNGGGAARSSVSPAAGRSTPSSRSNTPVQNGVAASTVVHTSSGVVTSMNPAQAQPVPQALYMNASLGAAGPGNMAPNQPPLPSAVAQAPVPNQAAGVRPQALYLNLNNQVYIQGSNANTNSTAATSGTMARPAMPATVNGAVTHSATAAARPMNTSLLNNGMMPAGAGQRYPSMTGVLSNSAGQTPAAAAASQPAMYTTQASSTPSPATPAATPTPPAQPPSNKILINVNQIRLGSRGFVPASSVQFKEDGVLFTLKEYPNAPLLLNIRAIVKCKANLQMPFPALFFYLESSCIKQIRSIFHMNEWEFSEKSALDKVRCVGIFPVTLTQRETKQILDIFAVMRQTSRRQEAILEHINAVSVLDLLYSTWQGKDGQPVDGPHPPSTAATQAANSVVAAARGQQRVQQVNTATSQSLLHPPPYGANTQMSAGAQMMNSAATNNMTMMANAQAQLRQATANTAAPRIPSQNPIAANGQVALSQTPGSDGRGAPVLKIPNDQAMWQKMKKNLVTGGVYQVEMPPPERTRKYCLWNGTQLVPCLVQDTEVQLTCTHLRIGSLRTPSAGVVRVQNDHIARGISFKYQDPNDKTMIDVFIPKTGIQECLLCTDKVEALFLYLDQQTTNRVRMVCKMQTYLSDPYYSPTSKKERQRHLILFLKNINRDQKESLMQIKMNPVPGTPQSQTRALVQEINILRALKILSAIKSDSMVQGKIDDFFGSRLTPSGPTDLSQVDALVRAVSGKEDNEEPPLPPEGDDDDVIMTSEEIGIKCPYTQQVMKEPIKNKICGHNYEKAAIIEFMARKRQKNIEARCPYAGCGNTVPLRNEDMEDNLELKSFIEKNNSKPAS